MADLFKEIPTWWFGVVTMLYQAVYIIDANYTSKVSNFDKKKNRYVLVREIYIYNNYLGPLLRKRDRGIYMSYLTAGIHCVRGVFI